MLGVDTWGDYKCVEVELWWGCCEKFMFGVEGEVVHSLDRFSLDELAATYDFLLIFHTYDLYHLFCL